MIDQLAEVDALALQHMQQVFERSRVSVTGISSVSVRRLMCSG
jgi:hypothetical protein